MYTKKICDGMFYKTVTYNQRLKYCPNGSAGVSIMPDGEIMLISYTTVVCKIDKDGFLTCYGTYSATTRKHIAAFLKEFAPTLNYYNAKHCFENNVRMNIHTGEIIA